MSGFGYEIDYMPVGVGEKSGDAIVLRFGNLKGKRDEQVVIVVDGGTKESGRALVQHLDQYYGTNHVDLIISTHPDSDHVSGLTEVVENCTVGQLAMHLPWAHASAVSENYRSLTANQVQRKIVASLTQAATLDDLARRHGIEVVEPWQGMNGWSGMVRILGPSLGYYELLLPNFREMPGFIDNASPTQAATVGLGDLLKRAVSETMDMLTETLQDPAETDTAAENRSSVITLLTLPGSHKVLLTGDAGADSLGLATDFAESQSISLLDLAMFDLPHHGSKRNIGPTILNRINGRSAAISASKDAPKHPAQKVINALHRRNMKPVTTEGSMLRHHYNAPERPGWRPADIRSFKSEIEDEDDT